MGACGGKSDSKEQTKTKEQKQLAINKFEVGPNIFVNLKQGDITDNYLIQKILGEGSYGQVRLVTHKKTNQLRAMKQIQKKKILKEQEDAMFSEVALLKDMDHPHIVKLFELYQDSQNYYLVTEYLNGGELLDKLTKLTTFNERTAADYMKQVLSALAYCHAQNIIHRDMKPSNIMLQSPDPKAGIKVIDFGTAKKQVSGEKQTQVIGTPLYIAPEVIDKQYTEKCDIWSCGVILYQILTGKFPFDVKVQSLQQLFSNIKSGKYNFTSKEFTSLSFEAQNLIKQMLQFDPSKRPSAQQILDDPWIKEKAREDKISLDVMSDLGKFHNESNMRAAIMQLIAGQMMSSEETEQLTQTFSSMDKNKDGQLSKEEMYAAYTQVFNDELKAKHLVDEIFQKVDSNNSGKISYTEFLVASAKQNTLLSKTKIDQAFKMFDKDGNGVISRQELQDIMCGVDMENQNWNQIIGQCDKNGDGNIQYEEFAQMLLQTAKK
uniref:MSP n=1 Tax=Paramecium caudatum TaxID=5885 RepID=X5CKX1_PARCA|nr:MSP [Paramecium caudatum]